MQTIQSEEERRAFFNAVASAVFRTAHEHRGGGPNRTPVVVDASAIVDALAFTQALVLEVHPKLRTDAEIRHAVERVGQELFRLVKAMRASTEQTGTSPITDFGGGDPMAGGTN